MYLFRFFCVILNTLLLFSLPLLALAAVDVSIHVTVLGAFNEHFAQPSGSQPDGWRDETNDSNSNAELEANGLGTAKLTKVDANTYGQVYSANMTLNLNVYDTLRIGVTEVDFNTDYVVSLAMQDGPTVRMTLANTGAGVFNYDIKAITGWSGEQTFALVLTTESSTNGLGTQFDEVSIFQQSAAPVYEEYFEEATGQPGGWWDETNDSSNNAEIDCNGLGSAHVTEVGTAGWGKVLSDTMTINLDTYRYLFAQVTLVDPGASYKITLKLDGDDTLYELYAGTDTGKFCFDINSILGWSGSQTFSIVLVAESASDNIGAWFDEIKIDRNGF